MDKLNRYIKSQKSRLPPLSQAGVQMYQINCSKCNASYETNLQIIELKSRKQEPYKSEHKSIMIPDHRLAHMILIDIS